MSNWLTITKIAQHCYGVLAQQVGIPFNIYRIQPTSNGNWIQPQNLIAQNVRVDRQPMLSGNKGFESAKRMETFWYELMADCTPFLVGDIFVSNDQVLNQGSVTVNYNTTEFVGLCLAENMPTRAPIAARINTTAQLYTASLLPNRQNYFDSSLPNRMPIILQNGSFSAVNTGQTAAVIPVASTPFRNFGQIYSQPTANVTPAERRLVYIPPMPGYVPIPTDEILFADGSRYILESNYIQQSGTAGTQAVCVKIVSGQGG